MDQNFLYKIDLPFTNGFIHFKELNTKNQLDIEKINLYYPQHVEYYNDFHESFLKVVKNCIENYTFFEKIDIIEYILFCLKLRIVSIGNILEFKVKPQDEDTKEANIKLDLNEIVNNLFIASLKSLKIKQINIENPNVIVNIGWPSVKSIKFFYDLYFLESNISEKIIESIPQYIKSIVLDNQFIDFENFTHEQKEVAYNSFPVSLKNKVENAILQNIKDLNQFSLLNVKYFDHQKFNFYDLFYIELIKLLFSQNPKRIYEEIFVLSSFSIESNYVLNLSHNERKIYLSFIESQRKSAEAQNTPSGVNMSNGKSVEDLAVEFGDIPPN